MTEAQYTAKNWLMLLCDYEQKLKAEKRTLEMLQAKLYKGVSSYEAFNGRKDPETARAAYEDALLSFSEQSARVEKAQKVYLAELELRREIIEAIPLNLQSIAIDRYINGIKWDNLERLHGYSKSNLFKLNIDILENVAEVLNAKNTNLEIIKNKRAKKAATV